MKVFLILLSFVALLIFVAVNELRAIAAIILLSNLFLVIRGVHKSSLSTEFSQNVFSVVSSLLLTAIIYFSAAEQVTSLILVFILVTFYALYSISSLCSLVASKWLVKIRNKLLQ